MSEQAVQATVSGPMMGKVFTKTATDDQWDGNTLTDSLSGQQIGILMPGAIVNQVQFQYTAGLVAWRIQNAATLTFQRFGFGTKDGFACFHSTKIAPYHQPKRHHQRLPPCHRRGGNQDQCPRMGRDHQGRGIV